MPIPGEPVVFGRQRLLAESGDIRSPGQRAHGATCGGAFCGPGDQVAPGARPQLEAVSENQVGMLGRGGLPPGVLFEEDGEGLPPLPGGDTGFPPTPGIPAPSDPGLPARRGEGKKTWCECVRIPLGYELGDVIGTGMKLTAVVKIHRANPDESAAPPPQTPITVTGLGEGAVMVIVYLYMTLLVEHVRFRKVWELCFGNAPDCDSQVRLFRDGTAIVPKPGGYFGTIGPKLFYCPVLSANYGRYVVVPNKDCRSLPQALGAGEAIGYGVTVEEWVREELGAHDEDPDVEIAWHAIPSAPVDGPTPSK